LGLEGGMMGFCKAMLAAAIATSLLLPATAFAEITAGKQPAKIKVHPKRSRGYGFLPGYRQPPALSDWRAQNRISAARPEWRFYGWDGQPRYGFGYPGYYRGRYNGGSFGPCWTSTPIGMMPTCGQ
jgi:hypothetical protein